MMMLSLVTVGLLATTLSGASAAQCACATGDVHVRSGVGTSHAILGVLTKGSCANYEGDQSSGWVHVNFNSKSGWISGHYVNIQSCSGGSSGKWIAATLISELSEQPAFVTTRHTKIRQTDQNERDSCGAVI